MSSSDVFQHHVFVDFENVPSVDLSPIADLPVLVTLLIGGVQNKLDTDFVEQIHAHAAKVRFVKLSASGRNALDLALAYYLGRAVVENGQPEFHIVSRDKDFEPLLTHLRAKNVKVSRSESFAALPFLSSSVPEPTLKERRVPQKKTSVATKVTLAGRVAKVVARLSNPQNLNRPSTERPLRAHIGTALGKESSEQRIEDVVVELCAKRVLSIDAKGGVVYRNGASQTGSVR